MHAIISEFTVIRHHEHVPIYRSIVFFLKKTMKMQITWVKQENYSITMFAENIIKLHYTNLQWSRSMSIFY